MSNGPWSTVIWDNQPGGFLAEVEASAGTWQRGGVTDQTHSFPLPALELGATRAESRAIAHDLFGKDKPRDRVLSQCWNGIPVYHGLILDSDYKPATGTLEVIHCDARELAAARWLFGIGGSTQSFNFTGSWRDIAREIVRIIYTSPISAAWPLRVTLPALEGGPQSFSTDGYEFRTGESLLTEVEEMPAGPDIDFHPTLTGNLFGWDLRIGTPFLTGPTLEIALQAAESPLTDVSVKNLGRDKVTGVHGIGDGSEWDMVRGGAAAPVSAGLARDTKLTVKNASISILNARSQGYLDTRVTTSQQWSFNVKTNVVDEGGIDPSALRLGSIIRIVSSDDWWIDDGWTEHRVLAFSGSLDDPHTINLTVETI